MSLSFSSWNNIVTAVNQVGQTKKGEKKSTFFHFDESGEKLKKLKKFLILTFL